MKTKKMRTGRQKIVDEFPVGSTVYVCAKDLEWSDIALIHKVYPTSVVAVDQDNMCVRTHSIPDFLKIVPLPRVFKDFKSAAAEDPLAWHALDIDDALQRSNETDTGYWARIKKLVPSHQYKAMRTHFRTE